MLVACGGGTFATYVYHAVGLTGPVVKKLPQATDLPSGYNPISVYNGEVTCQVCIPSGHTFALVPPGVLRALV